MRADSASARQRSIYQTTNGTYIVSGFDNEVGTGIELVNGCAFGRSEIGVNQGGEKSGWLMSQWKLEIKKVKRGEVDNEAKGSGENIIDDVAKGPCQKNRH